MKDVPGGGTFSWSQQRSLGGQQNLEIALLES